MTPLHNLHVSDHSVAQQPSNKENFTDENIQLHSLVAARLSWAFEQQIPGHHPHPSASSLLVVLCPILPDPETPTVQRFNIAVLLSFRLPNAEDEPELTSIQGTMIDPVKMRWSKRFCDFIRHR